MQKHYFSLKRGRTPDKIVKMSKFGKFICGNLSDVRAFEILHIVVIATSMIILVSVCTFLIGCSNPAESESPELYNLICPDSLQKGSPDTSYIYVSVRDPQGLTDIDSVYFVVIRPDGSSNGYRFYLLDNGLAGDSTAGDGIYTIGIQAPSTANQTGDYTFRFRAFDRVGNDSPELTKVVTAYEWPGPVISRVNIGFFPNGIDHLLTAARLFDIDGLTDIDSVWSSLYFDSTDFMGTYLLNDAGIAGDSVSGDGRYSREIPAAGGDFAAGRYLLRLSAVDLEGNPARDVDTIIYIQAY